jgi:hypothetical protein
MRAFIIAMCELYVVQLIVVWIHILTRTNQSKLWAVLWHIPFLPLVTELVKASRQANVNYMPNPPADYNGEPRP